MRRGTLGLAALAATATVVAAMFACTGSDPDLEAAPDGGNIDTGSTTNADGAASGDGGGTVDSGVADAGVDSPRSFSCNGATCAGDSVVCCKSMDLDGAACVERNACNHEFAKIECNDRADCPADNFCCWQTFTPEPDSGPPYYLGTHCQQGPCGEQFVCQTATDCPDASPSCSGVTSGEYVPTMKFCQ